MLASKTLYVPLARTMGTPYLNAARRKLRDVPSSLHLLLLSDTASLLPPRLPPFPIDGSIDRIGLCPGSVRDSFLFFLVHIFRWLESYHTWSFCVDCWPIFDLIEDHESFPLLVGIIYSLALWVPSHFSIEHTKHIEVDCYFFREKLQSGLISLARVFLGADSWDFDEDYASGMPLLSH